MRTTIDVQDALLQRARAQALATGRTLGDVVDDALRLLLDRPPAVPPPLPRARPSGLEPGVDLSPRTIKELLGEDELP